MAEAHVVEHPPTSTGIDNRKLAIWAFLASECLLFGALISAYLLYRGRTGPSDTLPADLFDIPFTSVSSFVLLMSSLTMVLAVSAAVRKDDRRMRIWLLATALLGSVFIAGQTYEFTTFVKEGLTVKSNPAGSAFFILTSFHGVHVTLGILMLVGMAMISRRRSLTSDGGLTVEMLGLYWHFVDVVWIVIFTVIYLIPVDKAIA